MQWIQLFIAGGVIAACFIVLRAWVHLTRQEQSSVNVLLTRKAPEDLSEARALLNSQPKSDVARFLHSALDTGKFDENVLSFYEGIHWSRYLAGVFVFLGLLGTVGGVSVSISNLSGTVSASSTAQAPGMSNSSDVSAHVFQQSRQLQDSIDGLLKGIQSASLSTLWGIAATLFVSLLNAAYFSRCHAVENAARRLGSERFLPLRRQVEEATDRLETYRSLDASVQSLLSATGELSSQLNPAAATVNQLASQTTQLVTKLNKSSLLLEAALTSITEQRNGLNIMSGTVTAAATKMGQDIRQLREALSKAQKEQDERQKEMVGGLQSNQMALQSLLTHFEQVLNDVTMIAETTPVRQELLQLKTELLGKMQQTEEAVTRVQGFARQEPGSYSMPLIAPDDKRYNDVLGRLETVVQKIESRRPFPAQEDFRGPPRSSPASADPPQPRSLRERLRAFFGGSKPSNTNKPVGRKR